MHWWTAKGPTGASTVSTTPAMHMLRRCHWHRQSWWYLLSGINDTGDAWRHRCQWHWWHASPVSLTPANTCFAGVIDTGKCMLCKCHWHRRMHASPVSMTPVRNFLPVSLTPVKLSKTVKVSLTGVVDTGKKLFTGVNDTGNACIAGVVDTVDAPVGPLTVRQCI